MCRNDFTVLVGTLKPFMYNRNIVKIPGISESGTEIFQSAVRINVRVRREEEGNVMLMMVMNV
jgi:hypothetical protein